MNEKTQVDEKTLTNPEAGLGSAASFADAESREILNLLGTTGADGDEAAGSCCGGGCCSV